MLRLPIRRIGVDDRLKEGDRQELISGADCELTRIALATEACQELRVRVWNIS